MSKSNVSLQDKYFNWALENELRPIKDDYFFYHFTFSQYVEDGIFSLTKNDKSLEMYLKDNGLSFDNIDKIIEKLLIEHSNERSIKDNILIILDYLRWSYGINVNEESKKYMKYHRECL